MEIWPIDFDKTLEEITEWHNQWKVERFGSDSLNPERYYNNDGRYLYGVREGESLSEEKAKSERVLEILCRLRLINQQLKGKGLSQHLQWREREQLKRERETLYREYLEVVNTPPEPQQGELKYYCEKAVKLGYMVKENTGYRRIKGQMTKAQLAYMLGHFLNPDNTFPDKKYSEMFGESRLGKAQAQLIINKHGNGKPRGYEIIDELLKQ